MIPPWLARSQRAALLGTAFLFSAGYATIGLALILLTVMAEAVLTRRLPWHRSPLDLFLLSFIVVFLVSGVVSPHRSIAVGSAALAALTIYLAFGPLYRHLRGDPGFLSPFLWAWGAGGVAAAVWAIVLHRVTRLPIFTPSLGQNALGTTMLMALLLVLGLFLTSRTRWRFLLAGGCAALALGLALTSAKGAWVGAAVGLASLLLLVGVRRAWRAFPLLLLIATASIALTPSDRLMLLREAAAITHLAVDRSRVALARSALAIFQDHPVLGTGLNTFSLVYPRYKFAGDPNPPTQPFAHNIFLNMAAEGGVLGLGTFAAIIIWAIVAGWQWHAASDSASATITSAAVLSSFLGAMVHQLFDGTMLSVHLGAGLWSLAAVFAAFRPKRPA